MIVYSKKISRFIHEIQTAIKTILAKEIGLKVGYNRFYDRRKQCSYPINVVVYNHRSELGYFDSNFYELGFHQCLMRSNKEQLYNIIRHELAHYMIFINLGDGVPHHGSEFREFCQKLGWDEAVYRATVCLEGAVNISAEEENAILRKVQKLMALAASSNKNEAEQAMIKSQQLLLKHNLEFKHVEPEEETWILKRIIKQKKMGAKTRAIGKILETFFVSIVYNRTRDCTYLEILGNSVNVEIAEYVAMVLDSEFENLWNQAKAQAELKGSVAKNSFFLGLAKGYCDKINALKRNYQADVAKAILVLENKLANAKEMAYPRLSSVRGSGTYCADSSALGEKMGRQLSINPALGKSTSRFQALIGYLTG